MLATLFVDPLALGGLHRLLLSLPLCLGIAVVYKTLRLPRLENLPGSAVLLALTIVVGMYAVGVGLWVLFTIFA